MKLPKKYGPVAIAAATVAGLSLAYWQRAALTSAINPLLSKIKHPANVHAFLAMLRYCEGTEGVNGYRTMFGYHLFTSFADHPQQYFTYTDKAGKTIRTSAAGAYQFIYPTWKELQDSLGLPDFSPASQDAAAIQKIKERGAYDDIIAGDIRSALIACRDEWASLPTSPASQPHRTLASSLIAYTGAGGTIA